MIDLVVFSSTSRLWLLLPLIICISLVYAGTHHEQLGLIVRRAWRTFKWITGFMLLAFGILYLIQYLV